MAQSNFSDDALHQAFASFAKYGNARADGRSITLTNADKWMKQAKIIDGKHISTTDTAICFNKMRSKTLSYEEFLKYVDQLATYKKIDSGDLRSRLVTAGEPGATHATTTSKSDAVQRLTNTAEYTGTHKQRFDESGKGKGVEGREDVAENRGYVQGYKEADTYDKTHK